MYEPGPWDTRAQADGAHVFSQKRKLLYGNEHDKADLDESGDPATYGERERHKMHNIWRKGALKQLDALAKKEKGEVRCLAFQLDTSAHHHQFCGPRVRCGCTRKPRETIKPGTLATSGSTIYSWRSSSTSKCSPFIRTSRSSPPLPRTRTRTRNAHPCLLAPPTIRADKDVLPNPSQRAEQCHHLL